MFFICMTPFTRLLMFNGLTNFVSFIAARVRRGSCSCKSEVYGEVPRRVFLDFWQDQDFVSAVVEKVKVHLTSKLKKQLPIADPKHTSDFLQQVQNHYENRKDDPEMSQEKLYYLATSTMVPTMKVKWLER